MKISTEDIRDRVNFYKYLALLNVDILKLFVSAKPQQVREVFRRYKWFKVVLKYNNFYLEFCRGRKGRHLEALAVAVIDLVRSIRKALTAVLFENEGDVVLTANVIPNDIPHAMGLKSYMYDLHLMLLPIIDPTAMEPYIDRGQNEGIPPDVCALPKTVIGALHDGQMLPGVAAIMWNYPCDGNMMYQTLYKEKTGMPIYMLDTPDNYATERAISHFASRLGEMILWLEEHTPGKMNWDVLRDGLEKRNQAFEIEQELWETLKMKPAPIGGETLFLNYFVSNLMEAYSERTIERNRRLLDLCQANIREGKGALEEERFRALFVNVIHLGYPGFFRWAEQKWGVNIVMDTVSFRQVPYIDTSTPESMLKGLAQVYLMVPMGKHNRGPAETVVRDILYLYEAFSLDMVWIADHVGCKQFNALLGMVHEECRKRGIPVLAIRFDYIDPRVVSHQGVRDQVDRFMENVMKAKPLHDEPPEERTSPLFKGKVMQEIKRVGEKALQRL